MNVAPIEKTSISEQVFEQLKDNLIKGEWKSGDKLPSENELAQAFNVSRVTIRQALSKLLALDLIETRFGEGSFVKEVSAGSYLQTLIPLAYLNKLDSSAVNEVLEFRLIYEIEAAGLAAERMSSACVELLKDLLKKMQSSAVDIDVYSEYDLQFHAAIARQTGNALLIQLSRIMQDILRETINRLTNDVGVANGLCYHAKLIDAFEQKDSGKAKDIMRMHLKEILK